MNRIFLSFHLKKGKLVPYGKSELSEVDLEVKDLSFLINHVYVQSCLVEFDLFFTESFILLGSCHVFPPFIFLFLFFYCSIHSFSLMLDFLFIFEQ